jgi:hypothetical protein
MMVILRSGLTRIHSHRITGFRKRFGDGQKEQDGRPSLLSASLLYWLRGQAGREFGVEWDGDWVRENWDATIEE